MADGVDVNPLNLGRSLARFYVRTAQQTASGAAAATRRLARAVQDGEGPMDVAYGVRDEWVNVLRAMIGVADLEERIERLADRAVTQPPVREDTLRKERQPVDRNGGAPTLRDRGAELLRRSAEVSDDDEGHPAFAMVIAQMAPDEARILRVLANDGRQAAVDVIAAAPLGRGSRTLARRLSMLERTAGLLHGDRIQTYLINLERLGLIRFSNRPLDDVSTYQVLEAQPELTELGSDIRPPERRKIVRRGIELTDFGQAFYDFVLREVAPEVSPQRR